MEIMGYILVGMMIAVFGLFCIYLGKEDGYDKREKEFQNNPVQFCVGGGYPVVKVSHGDGEVIVKILDKKFVKIIDNN